MTTTVVFMGLGPRSESWTSDRTGSWRTWTGVNLHFLKLQTKTLPTVKIFGSGAKHFCTFEVKFIRASSESNQGKLQTLGRLLGTTRGSRTRGPGAKRGPAKGSGSSPRAVCLTPGGQQTRGWRSGAFVKIYSKQR